MLEQLVDYVATDRGDDLDAALTTAHLSQLRTVCTEFGLVTSGTKRQVIERILAHVNADRSPDADPPAGDASDGNDDASSDDVVKPKKPKTRKVYGSWTVTVGDREFELTAMSRSEKWPYVLKEDEVLDGDLVLNRHGRPKRFQPVGIVLYDGEIVRQPLADRQPEIVTVEMEEA
jgi:hypothetical protein